MTKIKHIIFDLGEVIINVNPAAVKERMIQKGARNVDELHLKLLDDDIYYQLETGMIKPEEFRAAIRDIIDIPVADDDIDEAWNAMLLDIPRERIKFMTRLKSRYKLYLLSNTNHIHWLNYDRYFQDQFDYPSINTFFTHTWYSYLMGVRKPDPEIFRMVLEEGQFDPAEVAFIDDLKENVDAAATLGIHPVYLPPGKEIMDLFDGELELII
jgi:HAD superfamily hydrolase (TIGR01509 family)